MRRIYGTVGLVTVICITGLWLVADEGVDLRSALAEALLTVVTVTVIGGCVGFLWEDERRLREDRRFVIGAVTEAYQRAKSVRRGLRAAAIRGPEGVIFAIPSDAHAELLRLLDDAQLELEVPKRHTQRSPWASDVVRRAVGDMENYLRAIGREYEEAPKPLPSEVTVSSFPWLADLVGPYDGSGFAEFARSYDRLLDELGPPPVRQGP